MVNEGASPVGYARKNVASFLNCEPAHCQHEPSIFRLGLQSYGKKLSAKGTKFWSMDHDALKLSTKGTKFWSMNYDALNDSSGGNVVTTWKP
jgi:hypothetical protein